MLYLPPLFSICWRAVIFPRTLLWGIWKCPESGFHPLLIFPFLLWGVEMCVFLILNVVMVTGPLGCCFLHPTNAAVLIVWQSGCTWMRCEAGIGGDQPDRPAQQPDLEQGFLGTGFSPRRKDGNRLHSSKSLLGYTSEISTHFPSISAFDISG